MGWRRHAASTSPDTQTPLKTFSTSQPDEARACRAPCFGPLAAPQHRLVDTCDGGPALCWTTNHEGSLHLFMRGGRTRLSGHFVLLSGPTLVTSIAQSTAIPPHGRCVESKSTRRKDQHAIMEQLLGVGGQRASLPEDPPPNLVRKLLRPDRQGRTGPNR
eukprot:7749506-Alexandrium_andersonii.AAC.1